MPFFTLSELRRITRDLGIHLAKERGQCFLIDKNIKDKIIEVANLDKNIDVVLEIGPGLGLLTDDLISSAKKVYAVEIDKKAINFLRQQYESRFNLIFVQKDPVSLLGLDLEAEIVLINGNALKIPWPGATKIVSNIPYQISGPILIKILKNWAYSSVILMVQKEFADRLVARPNTKNYSRLSAAVGLFLDVTRIQDVSKECFYPVPRVTSSIIQITANNLFQTGKIPKSALDHYLKFLEGIFPYKNKTIRKAMVYFFKNYPDYREIFPFLTKLIEPSDYTGILRRKVRSFAPIELYWLIEFGKSGENSHFPELQI